MKANRLLSTAGVVFFTAIGVPMSTDNPPAVEENEQVTVGLTAVYKGGPQYSIEFSLVNKGDQPIEFSEMYLPWRHEFSMTLILVRTHTPTKVLTPVFPIDDPTPKRVLLAPGEPLNGKIDLKNRYPDIEKVLNESGIDVFWAYHLVSDGRTSNRVGGWITIPKLIR